MNCKLLNRSRTDKAGFTLAEVLAAMLFMAIVIPVAVGALRLGSLAGTVATRKAVAARIADRVLNEMVITGQGQNNALSGKVQEGPIEYSWSVTLESSGLDTLRVATVDVTFPAQGKEYDVKLSTLLNAE
jgi:type II secretory pathway pseudopilin PulG